MCHDGSPIHGNNFFPMMLKLSLARLIFGLLLLLPLSSFGARSLLDTWQLQTQTGTKVDVDGTSVSSAGPTSGQEFVTFNRNKTVTDSEWIIADKLSSLANLKYDSSTGDLFGYLPHKPYAAFKSSGRKYSIAFDIGRLNARYQTTAIKMTDPWLGRSGYVDLLNSAIGSTANVTGTRITQYSHQGQISRDRQSLAGSIAMKAEITYDGGSAAKTALATITTTYTGTRFPIHSTCCGSDAGKNETDSTAFLKALDTLQGIQTTSSRLKYLILQEGLGEQPAATNTALVSYRGFFPTGKTFDSGVLVLAPIGVGWIQGWIEGVPLMKKSAKYRFFIPASLAYGDKGNTAIGPKAALVFDIELIDFQ